MSIRLRLLAVRCCSGCAAFSAAALDAVPSRGVDLSGSWKLNAALSDDAEHMLAERQREERERYMQWRRQQERMYPPGRRRRSMSTDPATPREPSSARRASMKRREENLHKMLAISDTLAIRQDGATLDIVSAVESRRVVAGSHTQVSMPEGELADSKVGWDGQWFVIERSVRSGPRVVEKFRLVPKTGQLEYRDEVVAATASSPGMKVRRVFDRVHRGAAAGRSGQRALAVNATQAALE